MSHYINSPEWYDDRVEGFVDGLLPAAEQRVFEERIVNDELLQMQVDEARTVVGILRSQDKAVCRPEISDAVLDYARKNSRNTSTDRVPVRRPHGEVTRRLPLRLVPIFRGSHARYAAVVAAAFLAGFALLKPLGFIRTVAVDEGSEVYTPQDVERALREAKFAFAVVSDASRNAGRAIRTDAVQPVRQALGYIISESPQDADVQVAPARNRNNNQ